MMVSHKLRTPLNGILGSLEVLRMDSAEVSAAEISEFVLMAHQSAERLNTAVEKVLRFAERSQRPATGAAFVLAGLEPLVRSVAEGLSLTSPAVSVDGEARSLAIPCSPEMIEWVLFELLENGQKFHPRQAPAVEVTAHLDRNRRVALTVSDDGVTLSPELLEQASRPFFQGEKYSTNEVPGMGLGLASVFALVWQAGGSCRIRNRTAGTGVSVELHWPCAGLPPNPEAASTGSGKPRGD